MKVNKQAISILSLVLGAVVPTLLFLYDDWCYVKKLRCPVIDWASDNVFLLLLLSMAAVLIYCGLYGLFRRIIPSLVVALMLIIALVFVDMVVLYEFHFWIEGSE